MNRHMDAYGVGTLAAMALSAGVAVWLYASAARLLWGLR